MTPKADIPRKMTLLLTRDERTALDDIRRARGDRSAAATIRALIRDASERAPTPRILPLQITVGAIASSEQVAEQLGEAIRAGLASHGESPGVVATVGHRTHKETGSLLDIDRPIVAPGVDAPDEPGRTVGQEVAAGAVDLSRRQAGRRVASAPAACPLRAHHAKLGGRPCPGGCGA